MHTLIEWLSTKALLTSRRHFWFTSISMEEGGHVPEAYRASKDLAISNISRAAEVGSREVLKNFYYQLFCFLTYETYFPTT